MCLLGVAALSHTGSLCAWAQAAVSPSSEGLTLLPFCIALPVFCMPDFILFSSHVFVENIFQKVPKKGSVNGIFEILLV